MKAFCFLLLFIPASLTAQSFWVPDTVTFLYKNYPAILKDSSFYEGEISYVHSLPTNYKHKRWIIEYDKKGKIIQQLYQTMDADSTVSWKDKRKILFSYDTQDSLILILKQEKRDDSWVSYDQEIYLYSNQKTECLWQKESHNNYEWNNRRKSIFLSDSLKRPIETIHFSWDEKWFEEARCTFNYEKKKETHLWENFKDDKWQKTSIHTNKYDKNKNKIKYTTTDLGENSQAFGVQAKWKYNSKNQVVSYVKIVKNKKSSKLSNNKTKIKYDYDKNDNLSSKIIRTKTENKKQNKKKQTNNYNKKKIKVYKFTYTYNADNNRVSTLIQIKEAKTWENYQLHSLVYENNNVVFGECKVWENDQWVNGNGEVEIVYNNGELLFDVFDFGKYHQFRGSYKEIKINNE